MNVVVSPAVLDAAARRWRAHPFYMSSVVLGLDIGLEGIGVCVRCGSKILYAKTWAYDVPEPKRLGTRRQLRAARHCRANRKTRLHRLRLLFESHGLPWLEESSQALQNSDPYTLRYRAVASEKGLASKEALSIAIRHCVTHRGHDYRYFNDEGSYPWGDATDFKRVMESLRKLWLTGKEAQEALADVEHFEWEDVEVDKFRELVREREAGDDLIETRLAAHAKGDKNHTRVSAKGEAYPRTLVRSHLDKIIARHSHLIDDVSGFSAALFRENRTKEDRGHSIFYYHRKTKEEMKAHFAKKKARCGYAPWLGISDEKGKSLAVAKGDDSAVRQWRLLEFAVNREIELETKAKKVVTRWRVSLDAKLVKRLLDWLVANPNAKKSADIQELKGEIAEALKVTCGGKPAAVGGKNGSDLNSRFFTTLRDLLAPSMANRSRNAPMCTAAAERLYAIATVNGTDFTREGVNARLKDCNPAQPEKGKSLYDFRRIAAADIYGVYPQVEFLMGQRVKKDRSRHGAERGHVAVKGKLQLLFERELAAVVDGAKVPDFCVVEVARDLPKNTKQKKERDDMIAANRNRREKLYAKYGYTDADKLSDVARSRIELHDQQGGVCPFTGESLGDDPLGEDLDREHLFPESRGGLTMDENLVLTFSRINRSEKKNRTPREYASHSGKSFEQMLALTAKMRWGKLKREVFAWEDGEKIPELGNTTRVAQLARQLHAELARWMGCITADQIASRIGTPSGFQTAACRRAWQLPLKDRSDLTHHLVDAAILAFIPPREGQNYVVSGGIFYPLWNAEKRREMLGVLPIGPHPDEIARLAAHDADECPVQLHRSSSNHRRIHDKTHLGVVVVEKKGEPVRQLRYRKELDRTKFKKDAVGFEKRLIEMGIARKLLPKRDQLEKWLEDKDAPQTLPLQDGSVIRVIHEDGDQFHTPFGFTCRIGLKGEWQGIKVHTEKFDGLEIWTDRKESGLLHYARLRRPAVAPMQDLFRIAFRWLEWRQRQPDWVNADDNPEFKLAMNALRDVKRDKRSWKSLVRYPRAMPVLRAFVRLGFDVQGKDAEARWEEMHNAIWGTPLTHKAMPVIRSNNGRKRHLCIRKGEVYRLGFDVDGEITMDPKRIHKRRWFRVSAVKADNRIELTMLTEKPVKDTDGKAARKNKDGIPYSVEKSDAASLAAILGLPPCDDPPPHPPQRKPRSARSDGQADLGLE